MRIYKILIGILVGLVLALFVACGSPQQTAPSQNTQNTQPAPAAGEYPTVTVTPKAMYIDRQKVERSAGLAGIAGILGKPDRTTDLAYIYDRLGILAKQSEESPELESIGLYFETMQSPDTPRNYYDGRLLVKSTLEAKQPMQIKQECRGVFCRVVLEKMTLYITHDLKAGGPGWIGVGYRD